MTCSSSDALGHDRVDQLLGRLPLCERFDEIGPKGNEDQPLGGEAKRVICHGRPSP